MTRLFDWVAGPAGARHQQEVDAAVSAVRELLQQAVQGGTDAVRQRHLLLRRGATAVRISLY